MTCLNLLCLSCQRMKSDGPRNGAPSTIHIRANSNHLIFTYLNLFWSLLLSGAIWGTQKCCSIHYPHHTKFKSFFNFNLPQSILSLLPAGEIWWTQNWFIRYWHQTKFKPYKFWLASIYSVSPASWWDLRDPELVFHPPPAWVQIQTCRMLIYCSRDTQKNSKFLPG